MSPMWSPPNIGSRPVVLLGAGVLGRRIATVFVAAGYNVRVRDPSQEARDAAIEYIDSHKDEFSRLSKGKRSYGEYSAIADIDTAVKDAWLVIEAVPEKLELKIDTFAEVDQKAPADCIFGSNSSSIKSRLMIEKVSPVRRAQVLNVHFTMPPTILTVELMTDGETNPEIFPFLTKILDDCGMLPVTARKESTGFIFNRLWAAVKREILTILAEGVSEPGEVDKIWDHMFKNGTSPCRLMDQIGLDTVAFVENTYIEERKLDGSLTVDFLRENYIKEGRLGLKSGKGGLYPPAPPSNLPSVYFLDVGLGGNCPDISLVGQNGKIIRRNPDGTTTALLTGLNCPDGIDVSPAEGRMFWTNMGRHTSTHDGSVHSANLDGSDTKTLLAPGEVHTPKQIVVDEANCKLYFCDREGMGVHRIDFDGQNHQILVKTGDMNSPTDKADSTRWCVGITLDTKARKLYWIQKGPSKSGRGRIFRANMVIPSGENASNRSDIETLFEGLPEPVDVEFDSGSNTLYWTDRGEHPTGSSLNKASVGADYIKGSKPEIIARHFHEPIGLKLDTKNGHVYVTDLGGSVYRLGLDGSDKIKIHEDDGCYTGVTLVF
ncbi:hypothetical protein Plec18167_006199 [Paecilomyces lecythidis]|uniref:3-hydroxyacyl-CoA dehydrogenase n=1 Tax=Paecilomyces lecythidis TaxID=3004212 RepID=A0ABR3XDA3_9EURO